MRLSPQLYGIALLAAWVGFLSVQPVSAAKAGAAREKMIYSFCSDQDTCPDGAMPQAGLVALNGMLYGTTGWGGSSCTNNIPSGCGTIFSIDPKTGAEKVLYSFCQQDYCADGKSPYGSLIALKGSLYGTTPAGGTSNSGSGTVFSFDPKTGTEKVIYSFCSQQNCTDGAGPFAGLVAENGLLYGTTFSGGRNSCGQSQGCGTVFSVNPATGAETVLYSFCSKHDRAGHCTDGWQPVATVIDLKGTLYGTTQAGGAFSGCDLGACGTVFSVNMTTGKEKVLHSFAGGSDGSYPMAGLVAVNGVLYGTTSRGGIAECDGYGCGTLFSLDPGTSTETVLHTFCSMDNCADGAQSIATLIDVKGKLYGTTEGGGECCGTVFSVDTQTGVEQVVYSFAGGQNDGQNPHAGLVDFKDTLYGTTIEGGHAFGAVFQLKK